MLKCAYCKVDILREHGYLVIMAYPNLVPGGAQQPIGLPYCTWFCAAVAMDLCALKTLESVPMVSNLPACQNWVSEHNG